jgi:DNA-binding winged helix-turn-helix (wHTH) protein/TolB-like protein/Flp pilus assembly protein TadD
VEYKFADIVIKPHRFELYRAGELVSVEPLVFDLLLHFVTHPNEIIDRDRLIESVWESRIVSDSTIASAIKGARRVLGDDGKKQAYIKTVHGRGFMFVGQNILSETESLPGEGSRQKEFGDLATKTQPAPSLRNKKRIWSAFVIFLSLAMMYVFFTNGTILIGDAQRTIAILPFTNTNPTANTEFLGFAIADQIIGDLSYLETLTVRPSASVRKYTGQAIDPVTAASELGVRYVLVGNYLKENNLIRLNIELILADTNSIVWRESLEADDQSVFELQDQVATLVAKKFNLQFSDQEIGRIEKDLPNNSLAYEYYLRGLSYPLTDEGDLLAIAMLDKSRSLDPNYAPSYAELGYRIHRNSIYGSGDSQDDILAEQYLIKALALNDEQLAAMAALATLYTDTGRTSEALKLIQKMLAINPRHSLAIFTQGYLYRYAGLLDRAKSEMEKAVLLDPNNDRFRSLGITYFYLGEYQKSIDFHSIEKQTSYALGWQTLGLYKLGRTSEALELAEKIITQTNDGFWPIFGEVVRAIIRNDLPAGRSALEKASQFNIQDAETNANFASYHAALGENEKALELLEQAINKGYFNYPYFVSDSFMNGLRDDPRFKQLMELARQKHEAFKNAL